MIYNSIGLIFIISAFILLIYSYLVMPRSHLKPKKYNNKKIHILFTALHDKSYKEMIALLDTVANDYIFTTIQDKRKTELNDFLGLTNKPYQIVSDYREAISLLLANRDENDLCIATGSLHFISEIRNYIKK